MNINYNLYNLVYQQLKMIIKMKIQLILDRNQIQNLYNKKTKVE